MKLQVPENISLRWEAWSGMGAKELFVSVVITAVITVAAVIFCILSQWKMDVMVSMITIIATFGCCAGLFTKMDNNQSIYDYLKQRAIYTNEQQKFWFTKKKEVLIYVEEENN